jgi:hypothetical protein
MTQETVVVTALPQTIIDAESFRAADKKVSSGIRSGYSGSKSIEQARDQINTNVIKSAAKEKTDNGFLQKIVEWYYVLRGKTGEQIVEENQSNVNEVLAEGEHGLKNIATLLRKASRKQEAILGRISSITGDVRTYECALAGYETQISEIESIISAYRSGKNPRETVTLDLLPAEYLSKDAKTLDRIKETIRDKKRSADIELTSLYGRLTAEGLKMNAAEEATQRLDGQYKNAMKRHVDRIEQQSKFTPVGYMTSIEVQVGVAKTEEKMEKSINKRNKVAGDLYKSVEENLDTILNPYEADYSADYDAEKAKNTIDNSFNEMGKQGEVGFESLRDKAQAVVNKYLG